jgi:pyridinium-3,5-biscarboxylic acid mononucleotide sulfurtransferase
MNDSKLSKLDEIIKDLKSVVVAFSGGVDSSFLVHRINLQKSVRMVAVTIRTPYIPAREIKEAVEFTAEHGINHQVIDVTFPEIIRHNPIERCYLCKKILFTKIQNYASENGYRNVADGTNTDDASDFRPGIKALEEMKIVSPLALAGITKNEIRDFSKREGLPLWSKPAMACLLTRIPYDTEISDGNLRMVEAAEDFLFEKGYPGTRVRMHGEVARIECLPGYLDKIVHDPARDNLVSELKKIGFRYISLDLEGYRTGNMNPKKKEK